MSIGGSPNYGGLGAAAYMAYRDAAGGKSLATGAPIPLWQDMDPKIREAWDCAADQVRSIVLDSIVEIAMQLSAGPARGSIDSKTLLERTKGAAGAISDNPGRGA